MVDELTLELAIRITVIDSLQDSLGERTLLLEDDSDKNSTAVELPVWSTSDKMAGAGQRTALPSSSGPLDWMTVIGTNH